MVGSVSDRTLFFLYMMLGSAEASCKSIIVVCIIASISDCIRYPRTRVHTNRMHSNNFDVVLVLLLRFGGECVGDDGGVS